MLQEAQVFHFIQVDGYSVLAHEGQELSWHFDNSSWPLIGWLWINAVIHKSFMSVVVLHRTDITYFHQILVAIEFTAVSILIYS